MKIVIHGLGAARPSVKVARVWALILRRLFWVECLPRILSGDAAERGKPD